MIAEEIRVFIEHLDGITSVVTSDHIMNLLEDVSGTLPRDKDKMLKVIDTYKSMSDEERIIYRVGRRGGAYRSINDLENDPATRAKIESLISEIKEQKGADGLEQAINEMVDQYI